MTYGECTTGMQARGILPAAVLPVNTRWLDLIADSVKLEEYRLDTEYWQKRLLKKGEKEGTCGTYVLRAGYSRDSKALLIDAVPIRRRGGKPAWGAQDEPYIVLRIKSAWVFDKDGSVRILWAIKDNVLKIFGRY